VLSCCVSSGMYWAEGCPTQSQVDVEGHVGTEEHEKEDKGALESMPTPACSV
jgi:hypothetical protein